MEAPFLAYHRNQSHQLPGCLTGSRTANNGQVVRLLFTYPFRLRPSKTPTHWESISTRNGANAEVGVCGGEVQDRHRRRAGGGIMSHASERHVPNADAKFVLLSAHNR